MFRPLSILFCSLLWIPLSGWSASADDYRKLRAAYQGAMDNTDAQIDQQRSKVLKESALSLDTLAATFKDSGNIGFHLEARNMAERIRRGTFQSVQPNKLMSAEVQEAYQNIQHSLSQVEESAQAATYRIQKVMVTQLEAMVDNLETAGEVAAAQLARAEQDSILNDETYLAMQQAENAVVHAPAPRRVLPTPVPPPVLSAGKPMLEVDIFKKSLSDHYGGLDYDDQEQNIMLTVQVRSRELTKNYGPLRVEVWAFGRSVLSKRMFKMLLRDTLPLQGLERGQTEELTTKSVRNVYDDNRTAQFGYKFYGYVCKITERETGKVIYTKISPSRLEADLEKIASEAEDSKFTL